MSGQFINSYPMSPLWYKKRVRNFFKNVFLPFCAGIAILILFTPYFQHHLKLLAAALIVTFGTALCVALRIEKREKVDTISLFEKVDFIRQTYETLQAQQSKDADRRRRNEILREQLSMFLSRGTGIVEILQYNSLQSFSDKELWEKDVRDYLTKNWEQSSVSRFQNPNLSTDPLNRSSRREVVAAREMQARISIVHDLISVVLPSKLDSQGLVF